MRDARQIINTLKAELGAESDKQLAAMLGMSASSLTMQIKRNSLDWNHLLKVLVDMDLNWLIRGDSFKSNDSPEVACPELEREVVDLRAQVSVLKDVLTQIGQGKGQASSAPVKSIGTTAQ